MTSVKERRTKPSATEFTFGRELGQGNFSRVFLATHKATKEVFAVKMIEKARIMRMKIRHPNIFNEVNMEKTVLNMLRHPNVVRMYHTFQDAANLYFLMEYVSNGELWDVLQLQGKQIGCTEGLAQFYGADIVNALEYMASRHIVHRDLKPENMIVAKDDGHIRLVDFGTAKNLSDISLNGPNFVGTPEYMSPETIDNKSVDCKSDLWSLGCILYQLLAGETPFQGGSAYLTFLKVKAGTFDFPEFFSDAAKDLIAQLLQTQPQARPSFDAIKAHPFFHGVDFAHHMNATAPEPTPDDRFVVQTAQAIAAYVAGSSGPRPDVLATAANLQPSTKSRLMHVLRRMRLLDHHFVYPAFSQQGPAAGRCHYATRRGYIGFEHSVHNQWGKPYRFVHISGPALGLLHGDGVHDDADSSWRRQLEDFEQVLMAINELHPVFVVLSGNMTTNDAAVDAKDTETRAQTIAAFQEVVNRALDPTIRVVFVPGEGTSDQSAPFGDDFYSFWVGGVKYIVLNSALFIQSESTLERSLAQDKWLQAELEHGSLCAHHVCVFSHHPFFVEAIDEPTRIDRDTALVSDNNEPLMSWNVGAQTRLPYVKMLAEAKVRGLFSSNFPSTHVGTVIWPTKEPSDDTAADEERDSSLVCTVAVTNTFASAPSSIPTTKRVFHLVHVEQTGFQVHAHPVGV
ncbi:AGC/PDK1 protein kinase [Aphanomyces invadans]|uniref:AGC/PDK1 protein kinase n=1 Tax=Aphanomyces invadans TaxID=157072 RepID=A0A024UMT4_9STRA|nr:AGC/PDK1 protein kinase [Aphanomyces invadans]ETW06893.1 AGC/PDK1 protein kinase [Aphanomyces invadans]|eukprot:XP_008864968.1 AGC/PDK1 protein kinase [Aphanomyces invadans]